MSNPTPNAADGPVDLNELRGVVERMTPLPWRWHTYTGAGGKRGATMLVTVGRGMLFVLDAVRDGMNSATLRFGVRASRDVGGLLYKASELDLATHPASAGMLAVLNAAPSLIAELTALRERCGELERQLGFTLDFIESGGPLGVDGRKFTVRDLHERLSSARSALEAKT